MRSLFVGPIDQWRDWARLVGIQYEDLRKWGTQPAPSYHCIFCGTHGSAGKFAGSCPKCKVPHGVEPCIHSYCEFGR